jgi:Uri superfamily endonuclease
MAYLVFFQCPSHVVRTGAATFKIEEGVYAYVGSCGASCLKRVDRHLRRPAARRWHVDYLRCEGLYAVVTPLKEVEVAKLLAGRCRHVPGFGSTDDPEAPSHLFRCGVAEALSYIGLTT